MKTHSKLIALAMVFLIAFGCAKGISPEPGTTNGPSAANSTEQPTPEPGSESAKEFTYRIAMERKPVNWSPIDWQMANEAELRKYLEAPLIDIGIAADGVNFEWIYESATALTDVTAAYPEREKWLEPDENGELPNSGFIYRIDLNPSAKWENGEPITSLDYIYSMQQALDPARNNYRASSPSSDTAEIKNAAAYKSERAGQPIYSDAVDYPDAGEYFLDLHRPSVFFGNDAAADYYEAGYQGYFMDADGNDLFAELTEQSGYIPVTDEIIADLTVLSRNFGSDVPEAWKEWCFAISGEYPQIAWEDVGFIADGDYTLYYITEQSASEFEIKCSLMDNPLVPRELYEAGRAENSGKQLNSYGTRPDNYLATGPYKIESFAEDRIVLTRNGNWYGWTDNKHDGQYAATRIEIFIIEDHAEAMAAFARGELDEITLAPADISAFGASANLLREEQSSVTSFVFLMDLDKLAALEYEAGSGANKKVLCYDDFGKAVSLSIDRAKLCSGCSAEFKPAWFLLNNLYYYDIRHNAGSQYRNTREAREAVLDAYGIEYGPGTAYKDDAEAYAAFTGYDPERARVLFQAAYEQAVKDLNYTDGQSIHIRCECTSRDLSEEDIRQQELLNEFVAAAAKGTGFEGKITFEFVGNAENRHRDLAFGRIEMIRSTLGGPAFYPWMTLREYCEPDYMGWADAWHDIDSWDPTMVMLTIVIDGESISKTIQQWSKSINEGGEYGGDDCTETRLVILARLESSVLARCQVVPFGSYSNCRLISKKINYPTENYNIMYGFGGIRYLNFNYNDEQWSDFVASQSGPTEH